MASPMEIDLPSCVQPFLQGELASWSAGKLKDATHCRTCKAPSRTCEVAKNRADGDICLLLHCGNRRKIGKRGSLIPCPNWHLCKVCKARVDKRKVKKHFESEVHRCQCPSVDDDVSPLPPFMPATETFVSFQDDDDDDLIEGTLNTTISSGDIDHHTMEEFSIEIESTLLLRDQTLSANANKLNWLASAFAGLPLASVGNLIASFGGLQHMKYYWLAEHLKNGGGAQYLITRIFQRSEFIFGAEGVEVATLSESIWHFKCFIQYTSMNNKQRKRQGWILGSFQDQSTFSLQAVPSTENVTSSGSSIFQATRHVLYKEMPKFYGNATKHSLFNILPIPPVKNVEGIACVSPIDAVRFLFANATDVDDILLDTTSDPEETISSGEKRSVFYVSETKASQEMKCAAREAIKTSDRPRRPVTVPLCWAVDWRDGFGANRTKQNRKPVVLWTFSLSPPKQRVNTVDNTFPIALGLKKNPNWGRVEHLFQKHMATLQDTSPIYVYHGGLKKVIPVVVHRIASMEDKVERADYTSTLACTSKYHRCFGKIVRFEPPLIARDDVKVFLSNQKNGLADNHLIDHGWSAQFVDSTSSNSAIFPSCKACRNRGLQLLRQWTLQNKANQAENMARSATNRNCCADWTLDSTTKHSLSFKAPKEYPTRILNGCPVDPPELRGIGLERLEMIDLTFDGMKQAVKFAFFHSSGARLLSWTKENCCTYLRTCGVNGKQQELLCEAAMEAHTTGLNVDYTEVDRIGSHRFPAAWNGDLAIKRFIELVMHLLLLGVAESNFTLINKHLTGEATFKTDINKLLVVLGGFNLSWLLTHPFSGMKLTTGPWVAENWLAWVRLSRIVCAWIDKDDEIKARRHGSVDIQRMVIAFHSLMAQLMSHSGVSQTTVNLVGLCIKEFLSCVREFDIRARWGEMAVAHPNKLTPEQWWLKSNYSSLLNLCRIIDELGPLINLYDGGGKGEKYIQVVKPHITRGVRDYGQFFVRLMEKIYKLVFIEKVEDSVDEVNNNDDDDVSTASTDSENSEESESIPTTTLPSDSTSNKENDAAMDDDSNNDDSSTEKRASVVGADDDPLSDDDGDNNSSPSTHDHDTINPHDDSSDDENEVWHSALEDEQMSKARTHYIYRNITDLNEAVNNHKPIAGVIIQGQDGKPVMHSVHKKPRGEFGWLKITFNDADGASHCGTWFAPLIAAEETALLPPTSKKKLTKLAKLASVAIPLRYSMKNHNDRFKHSVITNWWRERNRRGNCVFPQLDFSLYSEVPEGS